MNFGFNDEQELLRNTARKFFENECGSDTVRRLMETPEGISPELWKKIAEQGWLGLIYPESCDGMGLGLAICQTIMNAHDGAVGVERNTHKGTTFSFTLPIHTADAVAIGAATGERSLTPP